MGRVVHFELAAEDAERAIKFYTKVFDWSFDKWENPGSPYWLIKTGEASEMGIDGGMALKVDSLTDISNAIMVKSVDEAMTVVADNGGVMMTPKIDLGKMGAMAYFQDTEGNILSLFESGKK